VVLNVYKIIGADGKEYGPITAEQLRRWIAEGLAIAGLLLSILSIVLVVLFLVLGVALNSGDLWRKVQRL